MNLLLIYLSLFILLFVIIFIIQSIKIRKLSTKPKNNVHFYVTCEVTDYGGILRTLWLGKPSYKEGEGFVSNKWSNILDVGPFVLYKVNYSDFEDMKNGEIREVFLNMED